MLATKAWNSVCQDALDGSEMKTICITASIIFLGVTPVLGESHAKTPHKFAKRPCDFLGPDELFHHYFGKSDSTLVSRSETLRTVPNNFMFSNTPESLQAHTLSTAQHARNNHKEREDLAQQTLRNRIDHSLRVYFEDPQKIRTVKYLRILAEKANNIEIPLQSAKDLDASSWLFRAGYDVFSDVFFLALQRRPFTMGIRMERFSASLVSTRLPSAMLIRLDYAIAHIIPTANITYRLRDKIIETVLSRNLGSAWLASLVGSKAQERPDYTYSILFSRPL
jgi:hypothetical protein